MKFCSLSKLSLLLAAVLHVAFNTLSAAELRQEEERQRLAIILHSRQSSLPYHGGFAFKNVHGSTHSDALQRISKAVEGTKARTGALKRGIRGHHHHHPNGKESYVEALYPRSYGAYSISVSVGTPPQKLSVMMDTGSDLVWMPCTNNYTCIDCPAHTRHSKPLVFHPRNSSSVKRVSCSNPKCKAIGRNTIDGNSTEDLCSERGKCSGRNPKKCSAALCPAYGYEYVSGLTLGFLVSDTLTLALKNGGKREIKHFGVGCSLISTRPPYGIAGFGRGDLSLPSQLSSVIGDKFGYCLLNQVYEDQNQSSIMLLGNDAVPKGVHLNYTAFLLNTANRAYDSYYYVGLRGISIGKKRLKLPSELLRFDPKGHGGTIVDSGSTFSYLREEIFKEIVGAFDSQVGYSRASALEAETGLGLCYNVSGQETVSVPGFTFHFKGGSHMSLPIENYFLLAEDAICLAMVSIHHSAEDGIGPAVILGNQQQQDFYMLYDREKNRLGFTQQTCKPFG